MAGPSAFPIVPLELLHFHTSHARSLKSTLFFSFPFIVCFQIFKLNVLFCLIQSLHIAQLCRWDGVELQASEATLESTGAYDELAEAKAAPAVARLTRLDPPSRCWRVILRFTHPYGIGQPCLSLCARINLRLTVFPRNQPRCEQDFWSPILVSLMNKLP